MTADGLVDATRLAAAHLQDAFRSSRADRYCILTIVAVAVGFIALHALVPIFGAYGYRFRWLSESDYRIDIDRSYPEIFLYGIECWCSLLLASAYLLSRQRLYLAWSAVFAVIFLDDAFSLHERIGKILVAAVDLPGLPGLRAQDTGELITWTAIAGLLIPMVIREMRVSSADALGFGALIAGCFGVLVVFAVGMDMAHVLTRDWFKGSGLLFTLAEDGGEMLTIVAAWSIALLLRRHLLAERAVAVA